MNFVQDTIDGYISLDEGSYTLGLQIYTSVYKHYNNKLNIGVISCSKDSSFSLGSPYQECKELDWMRNQLKNNPRKQCLG